MNCDYHASKTMFIDDCMKTLRRKEHTTTRRNDKCNTTTMLSDEHMIYNNLIHTANTQIYYLKQLRMVVYAKRNEHVIEELKKQKNEIENEVKQTEQRYITINEHKAICDKYKVEHKQKMMDILDRLIMLKHKLNEWNCEGDNNTNALQSIQSTIDNNYSVLCNTTNTIYFSES